MTISSVNLQRMASTLLLHVRPYLVNCFPSVVWPDISGILPVCQLSRTFRLRAMSHLSGKYTQCFTAAYEKRQALRSETGGWERMGTKTC